MGGSVCKICVSEGKDAHVFEDAADFDKHLGKEHSPEAAERRNLEHQQRELDEAEKLRQKNETDEPEHPHKKKHPHR